MQKNKRAVAGKTGIKARPLLDTTSKLSDSRRIICPLKAEDIASSGKEGLDLLQQQSFRGVISDVRMPGEVNGADIHSWIMTHRPHLLSRMLFITGDLSGEEAAQLLSNNDVPCIEKPFHMAEFMKAVKRVIEGEQ